MTNEQQKQLGATLWGIADQLRGAMNADDFRDYMLSFLFLRYLSDNYESACKKELGKEYPTQSEGQSISGSPFQDKPVITRLVVLYLSYLLPPKR